MSNHKTVVAAVTVLTTLVLFSATVLSVSAPTCCVPNTRLGAPIATSGNNVYMAWSNNDTGHYNVFFAKSTDGGKTFKTKMISAPNKGHVIDQNTQISASGNNVYVTWWTNKTRTLMPVFRASNDNGDTFGRPVMLNSTG